MKPPVTPGVAQPVRARTRATMSFARRRLAASEGFLVVEALAASVLLIVALLGAFLLLDVASATSAATRARSGAVTLAREIAEDSRAIPWSEVTPSTIVTQLQAFPGLANSSGGSTWQVTRGGATYTVNATECSVDDPKDGYGVHDNTFCSDSTVPAGATLTDPNPIDMKRVTVQVTWTALHSNHTIQEVATLTSAGQALGLQTSGLQVATPGITPATGPTISSTTTTSLTFSVTAPSGTTAIVWTVNGGAQSWTSTASNNLWTSSTPWNISTLSDGTYKIGAQAEDANGVIGPAVTIPVILARNIPAAPNVPWYGFNSNLTVSGSSSPATVAELQWQPNSESNVIGYRIYNPSGTLICSTTQATSYQSCGVNGANVWCATPAACIDLTAPATNASNLTYKVAATYKDASGALQEGPRTSVTLSGTPSNIYTFAPTTGNTGSNCTGVLTGDMVRTYIPGSTDSVAATPPITFCSDPFSSGDTIEGGGTATAYFANPGTASCQVTATLSTDGSTSGAVTSTKTVPSGGTAASAYQFGFTNNQLLTMNAGDRLDLNFSWSGIGCAGVLHYGSTGAPSFFQTAQVPITPPGSPASLTVTTQADGTAVLTWPASTTGAPVSFYRIYRDGSDYTHRYDYVPATDCTVGTCTYTDVKRTSSHSYYVTGVGGTTPGSNMAESAATGPVTG